MKSQDSLVSDWLPLKESHLKLQKFGMETNESKE